MASSTEMSYIPLQESNIVSENIEIDVSTDITCTDLLYFIDTTPTPVFTRGNFKTDIIANYFGLDSCLSKIYHYDVEIKADPFSQTGIVQPGFQGHVMRNPERFTLSEEKCKGVFAELLKDMNCEKLKYIYDGKRNLLTSKDLHILKKYTSKFQTPSDGKKYVITIQPMTKYNDTNVISMQLLHNMTLYDTDSEQNDLLALIKDIDHRNTHSKFHFDRYFSFKHVNKWDIGKGLEIWRGYEQRVTLTQGQPTYILNVSELIFHKSGPVIGYVNELLGFDVTSENRRLESKEIQEIKYALYGLQIKVTYWKYPETHYVQDISDTAANDTFIRVERQKISVSQHFLKKNCPLTYPHLPCVKVTIRGARYFPFENCEILEGQPKLGCLNTDAVNLLEDSMQRLSLFTNVSREVLEDDVISPTELKCIETSQFCPDTGRWETQTESPSTLKNNSWIVLSFVDESKLSRLQIREFLSELRKVDSSVGGLASVRFLGISILASVDEVFHSEEIRSATFAMILLKEKNRNHDEIKFTVTYRLGLVNKCIKYDTICKLKPEIAKNICLTIRAILTGKTDKIFKTLKMFSRPIIIFGNAFSTVKRIATIASIVGSIDAYCSRYQVSCRVQDVGTDFIVYLEDMLNTILNSFYHYTRGMHPEKLIFFRSYTLLNMRSLINNEVSRIQKACKDTIGRIVPITFILLKKNPDAKCEEIISKDAMCTENKPLETTDTTPRNIINYDLNIYGCSKNYEVIHDDNKFSTDELKELTYYMCKVHASNSSIYEPAPIKYAESAASHCKKYANFLLSECEEETRLPDFVVDAIHKMECSKKTHVFLVIRK